MIAFSNEIKEYKIFIDVSINYLATNKKNKILSIYFFL